MKQQQQFFCHSTLLTLFNFRTCFKSDLKQMRMDRDRLHLRGILPSSLPTNNAAWCVALVFLTWGGFAPKANRITITKDCLAPFFSCLTSQDQNLLFSLSRIEMAVLSYLILTKSIKFRVFEANFSLRWLMVNVLKQSD
jgi:hypothetical protein